MSPKSASLPLYLASKNASVISRWPGSCDVRLVVAHTAAAGGPSASSRAERRTLPVVAQPSGAPVGPGDALEEARETRVEVEVRAHVVPVHADLPEPPEAARREPARDEVREAQERVVLKVVPKTPRGLARGLEHELAQRLAR